MNLTPLFGAATLQFTVISPTQFSTEPILIIPAKVLVEDKSQNRVIEALNVFQYVVCHPAFRSRDVILFFNKNDILLEKIAEGKKVTDYLPNVKFEGDPLNVKDVQV